VLEPGKVPPVFIQYTVNAFNTSVDTWFPDKNQSWPEFRPTKPSTTFAVSDSWWDWLVLIFGLGFLDSWIYVFRAVAFLDSRTRVGRESSKTLVDVATRWCSLASGTHNSHGDPFD